MKNVWKFKNLINILVVNISSGVQILAKSPVLRVSVSWRSGSRILRLRNFRLYLGRIATGDVL